MSAEQFPLTKQAGLSVQKWRVPKYYTAAVTGLSNETVEIEAIPAADVERWLEQAPVVKYVARECPTGGIEGVWCEPTKETTDCTARLVCIQPIVRDTAESLLRELIKEYETVGEYSAYADKLRERARKLLEGK